MPAHAVEDSGTNLNDFAVALDAAAVDAEAIPQVSALADISLAQAYEVQRLASELRVARGDALVGAKLGFTSLAKAAQMGVSDVIFGRLHASHALLDKDAVSLEGFIHPRVEPEVAFRLGRPFDAADADDPAQELFAAIDGIAAALEVIDSRYVDFRFSLPDVVADNASAAGFVVGRWRDVDLVEFRPRVDGDVDLAFDGEVVASGSTTDILGDPYAAVPAIARLAAAQRVALPAGSVLLAGAATQAVAVTPGTSVTATVAELGTVSIRTTDSEEN